MGRFCLEKLYLPAVPLLFLHECDNISVSVQSSNLIAENRTRTMYKQWITSAYHVLLADNTEISPHVPKSALSA